MAINVQKELKKLKKNSNGSNVQQSGQNTGRTDAEKQRVSANNAVLQKKNAEKVEDNGRTTAENQRAAANNVLLTGRTPEEKERKAESLGTPGALRRAADLEKNIQNAQKAGDSLKKHGEEIENARNEINRRTYYGTVSQQDVENFNGRVNRFEKKSDDFNRNVLPNTAKYMKEYGEYMSSPEYLKAYYQKKKSAAGNKIESLEKQKAADENKILTLIGQEIESIDDDTDKSGLPEGKQLELEVRKKRHEEADNAIQKLKSSKNSYYNNLNYADLIKQAEYADKIKNYSVSGTDNYINKLKKEERVPAYGVDYISSDDKPQSNGSRKYSNALDDLIAGGTAAQKATFRAIYENEGKEAAYKYIDVIQQLLDDKRADKDYSAIRELPDVARVPVEMAVHTAAGVNDAATGLKGVVHAVTGNTDYIPDSSLQHTSSSLTADENVGTWGRIWRSSFRSFGNMAPSIIIGNAAGTIAGGLGAAAGTAAKIGQAAQSGTFFMTTAGGAYRDAINSGKPYGEAVTYGIVNGASEVYLENLIGGIEGFGKSGAQRLLTGTSAGKAISARVGNVLSKASPNVRKAANILGYWVADASSEAVEEGLQEILDPFMQTIIFSEHDDAWDGFSAGQVFEAAAAGALTSFLMGAPRNYSMSKATSQVIKGNADADTISAVVTNEELRGSFENITGIRLDGDNEAAFKQITAFQAGVNGAENIDGRTKKGTNANVSRGKSFLESLPEDFKNMSVLEAAAAISDGIENYKAKALEKAKAEGKSLTDIIKEEGTPTPEKLIKDGKTAEELHNNEEIKRAATNVSDIQLTKAELKTDNGKKTDTLQKLSKALGVPIMLYHSEESGSDGFYDSSERTIYLNEGGVKPVLTALKHEIMHDMKLVDEQNYAKLKTFLTATYKTLYGEDAYNSYIEGKRSEYLKNTGKECSDEKASDEFCADTCMDLLTNEKFVKEFVKSRYSTAQRLKRCIKKILNKIKSVFGAEADETSLDDALMQLAKINGNVDYAERSRGYADVRNGSTETLPKMLDYDTLRKADSMLMSALYDYAEARKRVNEGFSEVRNNQDLSIDEKKAEYERRVNEEFDKESGEEQEAEQAPGSDIARTEENADGNEGGTKKQLLTDIKQAVKDILNVSDEDAEETSQQNTGVSYPLANLPAHTITEDTDTRTGETIYTLKFNEHLTPEQFNSARDEIKQNGGYYSRFKKGFIFKDDTLYKAYNEVYNKGTNTADNKTADSAEIGVQSNDTGRNVKETAAGLLQGVSGAGGPSDTGAVRGVRESSGDGGGNGEVSGHTQRQTGESVLSEHDAGTARSVHGHSEHVIKQVAAFIKKYAAKRNYTKKNYAPTTEMGAREFIEQETKNGYTLIDEGGAIISYLKSDGKNLSDEVKNWVNRLGKLGITVNVSDGKLKRFIEGYCAEFDGFFHKKLNEIFLSADILKEDIDAKNHELFHYIFHNYPEIADRFVNTLFSNLSDKFDPLIQSELEWIFDGYADGDIYSENNLLKLTDEITAYFITYLNFGHKNSNLFNSIINDRAAVEEAFNQMLDELERARSKTDGDADLSRTQENISKGENSDVQQGVLGRQDSDNDSVRESESVQKVEKDGDTGKENRNADGISGNENGVDVQDTQEISSSAGSESGGTVDDGVRKSDVRNGNDGTGHNGTDNVDVDGGADSTDAGTSTESGTGSTVTQENNLENAAANINAAEDTGVSENIEEQENEKSGAVTEENSDAARQKANESPSKEQINSEKQTSEQTKEQAQEQVKQKEQPEQAEELTEEQQNKEPENDSEQEKEQKPKNFSISKELAESIDSGRPSIKDNLEAIKVLHELEESGKKPTKAQLEILAKYKGWGGLAGAFAYDLSRLREVMTDEEIKSARSTVNDAYFTPTYVIDAIYSALKRLGCLGGNILEPSMGIGNFFGRIPKSLSEKSSLHGVEIDSISGRIASYLYSGADVKISGFQDAQFKDGAFDLIIGNVPFGDIKYDYKGTKYMIHDYFFMKSLDKLVDGGVMALLTSSGTLDKYDTKLRNELSRRADLVAAYRLPATVFSKNAGANVVTDLIIFRKRARGEVPNGESFINLSEFHGMPINEYFANHPENILGNLEMVRGQYGEKISVGQTGDVKKMLDGAISKLPKNLLSDTKTVRVTDVNEFGNKAQSFRDSGDGVVYADFQTGEVKKITGKKAGIARDYMAVRDAYNNLIAARNASDTEREELRKTLNKVYDEFVKKNGSLTSNRVLLGADSDFIKTNGLEIYDTKAKKIIKSEVFFKDTFVKQAHQKAGNALDALGITISETGGVDLSRIASLLGTTEQNAAEQLSDRIILTPDGDYQLMEIYLSGNVRQKLKAVEGKPGYERNEKLLRSVLPVQKTAGNITPQFGASWIKPEYIRDFISQLFGLRFKPTVSYDSKSGTWYISGNIWGDNTLLTKKYGTSRIDGMKLAEKALNMRSVTVKDADGNVDVAETKAAADKIRDIKDAFEEWAFKDTERREALVNDYNDRFNSYANMDFSSLSEYLTCGGLSSTFKPRPYQKRAVARIVFNGNTLLAHGVGTGKTAEMIISAMERKRLGITKKNMFVVPNHKVSDFRNDILKMYPGAKVIYLEKGANAAQRTRFLSQVAANEWDIVIMPHSSFGMLDVSDGTKKQFIQNEIARLEETVTAARREQGKSIDARFIRDLEKQKKSLEANLKKITESPKDNGIVFEDLGVDSLFVDEAHNFKNLPFSSKLSRVSGVAINKPSNKTRASRAENMFMMTDHLNNNGGTVIFATATPITNSLSEMYNMMRFLAPKTLEDAGIGSFDAWASVFGDIVTSAEIDPTGTKIRMKERFSKFKNVPEMVSLFRQVADILKTADVVKDLPKAKYVNVTNESNPIQQEFLEILDGLIDEVRANGQKSQNNMLSITKMGQLAAIDLRFVKDLFGGKYTEEQLTLADNRLSKAAANIYEEYKKSDRNKGTQFVFCDEGVNGNPGKRYNFNAYADLINKLVAAGIPREEIAVAQDYEDKGELSGKVNSGEIRVLIGSTAVMGEGMNAQVKAVALHHLTVPYRPSDIEQREGRIIRYGNENKEVTIYRYIQERSYDSYQWQMLERKAGFINQALSGGNVEELEEMSDFVLSAREAKSIASGNPLFLEKVQVEDKISNLKSKQRRFISELEQNKHRLATLPETISRLKKNSESYKADADTVKRNTGKEFEITLGKKTYGDRADAAKALEKLMRKVPRNGKEVELGTFRGLKLSVSQSIEKGLVFYLDGKSRYTVSAGDSAAGNLTRITNSTEKIETMYNDAENAIDTYNGEIKTLESEVKRTFPNETELTELQERLSQIDSELGIGKNDDVDMSEVIAEDSADNDEDGDISYSFNGRNKKAAEDGDEKYDYTKSFEQQVDDYKKGLIPKRDSLIVSGTPKVLRDIGFNALPVTINRQHVDYALNGTKDADHSLGESMLKQLPKALESPIAVINSDTEPNRVVAILGFTANGKNVVAPVQIDGFATQNYLSIDSNAIASVFGKGNVLKQLVAAINGETAGKNTLYYWDKKRALALLQTARLQLPRHLPRADSIHSIRESGTSVNAKYENVTNSQQFKRWFGDWENSPQRASKAVDKNGKPKKLYHGTNSEINAFDLSKSGTNEGSTLGKGIYLTDVKSIAESFGKNVYELYASIKRPFDLGQRGTLSMFYNKLDKEFGISKLYGEQYSKNKLKGENSSVFDFMKSLADKNGVDVSDILQSLGFDGVHDGNEWVAYGENQVKSTDNIGLYGKDTDNIFYSFNGRNSGETEQAGQSEQTDSGKYIPKGEKPFRDVNIPKEDAYGGKVSYGIRTYAEAESTPDERIATVLDDVKRGKYSHKVISDESALINAENLINTKGYAEAMQSILERVDYGFAIGKEDMALIELLLNNTQNYIDQSNALYNGVPATDLLVAAFINSASLAGQALQAVRAFKTLSPTAVLYGVESMANAENRHILAQTGRIVDEKNRQISGQRKGITTSEVKEARKKARENGEFLYSKKQELIVIDETLKNNLLKARTADEVVAARDAIIENIASQIVTKFGEKVRAWRYMAMLTNPRTHVRNTIGNTMNMGMRGISNIVSALAEQAAQKAGLISQADRKHGIIGFDAAKKAEYRKIFEYAGDYFDANSAELKGKSRYNAAMSDIEQARKIFETGWLERLRRFNSDKLEKEDILFMRREFASQFAHAAVARGYTLSDISNGSISKNVIKDLMLYAAREAQRTTFREANSFANALNKVSNSSTGAGILIDAIIPFKSTPMNILREGVRYSPVSIVSGIKQIFEDYSIKNASNGAIEHIDGVGIIQKFSEGMTGTALMALGAMLYQFGMLTAGDDDKDEYNLRKAKGEQSYSLRFGNVYFDISWAAPVCMPLLAGAQAAKIFEGWDSDKGPLDKALAFGNSLLGIATPILETSMMQGVLDVIKSMRYSEDGEMIGDAVTTAMSSLILQYCPSVLAAMGRVFDDVEYRTDLPDSSNGTAEYERFLRKVANKIPFVRRLNLPGTDIMGKYEQKKNIGDYALSLAQNTFIPGYISTLTGNGAAEHLCDVLEQSGDAEFLPNYVKDFTVDGVKHKMTAQELHDFNVQRGLIYDSVIPVLEKSDWYSGLDAGIKAKVLRELRDVSNEICKYKINDGYKIGKAAYAVMKKEDNPEYFAKYLRSMSKSFIIKAKNGADVDQADDEELAS